MSAQLKPYEGGDGEFDCVSILLGGVNVWNLWRIGNRGLAINLSGADLGEADLPGADLTGADLRWSYLGRANLSGASFRGADLNEAILGETNLNEADLKEANLDRWILRRPISVGQSLEGLILAKHTSGGPT